MATAVYDLTCLRATQLLPIEAHANGKDMSEPPIYPRGEQIFAYLLAGLAHLDLTSGRALFVSGTSRPMGGAAMFAP